jgi:hypothetical protein
MNFLRYEVRIENVGDVIEVILLGHAANVLVMDDGNFQNYQFGRRFVYYGGYYTRSPAVIAPPSPGHWNVIVDLGGASGQVNASIRVRHRR